MIVKMKFLSITGPKNDIERMAGQYLSKYEIQLENALTELKTVRDLRAYTDKNPYEEIIRQAKEYLPAGLKTDKEFPDMTVERAEQILREAEKNLTDLRGQRTELSEQREKAMKLLENMIRFRLWDLRYTGFWNSGISNIVSAGFQKSILTNLSGMSMIRWIRFSINAAAMRSMCGACILCLLLWRTR